jgi:hypothetical protein
MMLVSIYTYMYIIYIYIAVLLHFFTRGLKYILAGFGTVTQAAMSITHFKRILVKMVATYLFFIFVVSYSWKGPKLELEKKTRVVPPGWMERNLSPVLSSLVQWLFEECGGIETEVRHVCMDLFSALAQDKGRSFFQQYVANRLLISSFEHMVVPYPQAGDQRTSTWLEQTEAMLDCYVWAVGEGLLMCNTVFASDVSQLWNAISHFILFLAAPLHSSTATPKEKSALVFRTGTVGVRMMQLLTLGAPFVPECVWSTELLHYIASALLTPQKLAFDWTDTTISTFLPRVTGQMVKEMVKLPKAIMDQFTAACRTILCGGGSLLRVFSGTHSLDTIEVTSLSEGCIQLHFSGLLAEALGDADVFGRTMNELFKNIAQLSPIVPTWQSAYNSLLKLGLVNVSPSELLNAVFNRGVAIRQANLDDSEETEGSAKTTQGTVFYNNFSTIIHEYMFTHFGIIQVELVDYFQHCHLVKAIKGMLSLLKGDKSLESTRKKVAPQFLHFLSAIVTKWLPPTSSIEFRLDALTLLIAYQELEFPRSLLSSADVGIISGFLQHLLSDAKIELDHEGAWVTDSLAFFILLCFAFRIDPYFVIVRVIRSIPFLLESGADVNPLAEALERFIAHRLPVRSSEFASGSPEHGSFVAVIDSILQATVLSHNERLFQVNVYNDILANRHI